ncbi:MAG: bifunctional YncE family protein/alkaline phosphatase family protein, partial [Blastocatellia bacterium]
MTVLKSEDGKSTRKVYVSCWNTATVAVVDQDSQANKVKHITVANHPTAMLLSDSGKRLYVVNSGADSVSVIDTKIDTEVERIDTRLQEKIDVVGNSPESLALSADGGTLYVANSHSNSVAVVNLSPKARGGEGVAADGGGDRSKVQGFIPTGYYPSALALVDGTLFIANGKGTGFENSSTTVSNTGMSPNTPNAAFPPGRALGGQYILSLISGNISAVAVPDQGQLAAYTRQVMENNGMLQAQKKSLFDGPSRIKHVIYIIRENRSYDQVFGDIAKAGDGEAADGESKLAIFGDSETARRPRGPEQRITPNAHALALRFGLMDRFFVNSEASPDGH